MNAEVLVLAKTPVPGRVKTRLCPPYTPVEAARLAAAALADTLGTVCATAARRRTLVVDGDLPAPPGWGREPQDGGSLGDRIARAFAGRHGPALLIGMDTPQVTVAVLDSALRALTAAGGPDAVLGLAEDGGWWALGLRDGTPAGLLRDIPTSTADTGAQTLAALRDNGLRVQALPVLRDVDTADDAYAVAALCAPGASFGRAVAG